MGQGLISSTFAPKVAADRHPGVAVFLDRLSRKARQQLSHEIPEPSSEPPPQWHGKAMLGPVNDLVRHDPPQGAFGDILRLPFAQPALRGNRGGELDQFAIEQSDSSLSTTSPCVAASCRKDTGGPVYFIARTWTTCVFASQLSARFRTNLSLARQGEVCPKNRSSVCHPQV